MYKIIPQMFLANYHKQESRDVLQSSLVCVGIKEQAPFFDRDQ